MNCTIRFAFIASADVNTDINTQINSIQLDLEEKKGIEKKILPVVQFRLSCACAFNNKCLASLVISYIMELADSVADTVEDVGVTKRERNDTGDAGRCVKQSAKKRYTGKRKYCGNQYTKVKGANSNTTPVSHKKVKYVKKRKTDNNEGYRLFDIQIFEDIVSSLACPDCFEKRLYVEENHSKKKGFACFISVCVNTIKS